MNDDGRKSNELDGLYARVRDDLERERGVRAWLRARPTWLRVAIMAVTSAVAISAATMMMGAPITVDTIDGWVCSVVAMIVLFTVAMAAALRPLHRPQAGIGTSVWLVGLAATSLAAMLMASDGSVGAAASVRCMMLGAMVGAPVWIVGFVMDRAPRRNVALGGAVAALGGMAAAQILCPLRGLLHIVVDHFGGLVLLAAAFGVGRWLLARLERQPHPVP